jgi:ubiquinone/menaquinone biosynthesis C-methylase UbiE
MMDNTKKQKQAFLNYEADSWFMRNINYKYVAENDVVIKVLKEYCAAPQNVLEIGCSSGYRLNAIAENFPGANVTGIEPSKRAIEKGQQIYSKVNFVHGTADEMNQLPTAGYDMIIIGFVLYVIDRDILFKVIAETDRVLKNGGILVIVDFFSETPRRNPYKHIEDFAAYAFKQRYEDVFIASNLYQLLDKRSVNHSSKGLYDLTADYYDKYAVTTLRKDVIAGYK